MAIRNSRNPWHPPPSHQHPAGNRRRPRPVPARRSTPLSAESVSGRLQTPVSGSTSSTRSRRVPVAGDVGNDRAHLLVARHHQERRRATVGLHAGEVEAGLGLRQFARAMRPHRAAAVQIGIDQRRQDGGHSSAGSNEMRSSRRNDRSGRNPVATISSSTSTCRPQQVDPAPSLSFSPVPLICVRRNLASTRTPPARTS